LWFTGQKYFPPVHTDIGTWRKKADHPVFEKLRPWLKGYFAGTVSPGSSQWSGAVKLFKLNPNGTGFQKLVWQALLDIPYGTLSSYGAIAKRLGSSPRAVGGAVGHNPISILIPCHRVVGSGGKLTGYAGGLDRKTALLKLEGAV
jgi:methylated-DNA-[protein]-cysteine S-methyltransferase